MEPQLSIVIPAYNEAHRIVPTLAKIRAFLESHSIHAEILVVNDGSKDGTARVVTDLATSFDRIGSLKLLENPGNRGKGYSVRQGVLQSTGKEVLFTDADLSSPIEEYSKLSAPLHRGEASIALGSRALRDSRIGMRESRVREYCGRTFNLFVRILAGLPFKDTQCGFKLFTREAAQAVFRLQTVEQFGFDVEILFIAKKLGLRMVEVPVVWNHNSEGSRISVLRDGIRMGLDVLRIRYRDLTRQYPFPR